jgi:DNA polymerase-3 subunit beta
VVKFRCERDTLADALNTAGRAVSKTGTMPGLSGVRLVLSGDALTITGSDLDLTVSVTLTVAGEDDGEAVLPAKLASEIVRAVEPGAVHLSTSGDEASISAGRSEFSVRLIATDEFPKIDDPTTDGVVMSSIALNDALRQVIPAASGDDTRPILTGVLLSAEEDGLRLVATDSYRLAVRDVTDLSILEKDQQVLVPSRALAELTRVLGSAEEVSLAFGERDASFEVGNTRLTTRLIEGDFPNYRGLIPSNHPNRMTVGREALLDALRRVRLLARESTPVRLTMGADTMQLAAVTQDVGQAHEELDAKFEGNELTVAFNPEYLATGLEITPGDEVVLETVDAHKPALIKTIEGDDFLYLLMPVRVS